MKCLAPTLAFAALPMLFMGTPLLAQNVTGTWQGTLKVNGPNGSQDLRTVLKISRAADESLKATLYSIDQGAIPVNATTVTLKGTGLKIAIAQMNGTYEGTLSSDGNSINGTWTQGGPAIPLNLVRATNETAWSIPEPPPPQKPMAADANPVFEVATIKPSKPEEGFSLLVGRRGGGANSLTSSGTSLSFLMQFAYSVHARQIEGGPSWFESEKYDITAKPDHEGIPNASQLRGMMQKLLADRFELTFHREKKELPVYAITVLKTGPKLAKSDPGRGNLPGFGLGRGMLRIGNATMADFAYLLQANVLERPVVDKTGLTDRFDFTVKYTPDASQILPGGGPPGPEPAADNADAPPDLFTAVQQQLGLKIESIKAPVDVLVIDTVEKPSEN